MYYLFWYGHNNIVCTLYYLLCSVDIYNDDLEDDVDRHDSLLAMDNDLDASVSTDSDSNDESIVNRVIPLVRCEQNSLLCVALIASEYYCKYINKNEVRTSRQSGFGWLMDTLKTLGSSHNMF